MASHHRPIIGLLFVGGSTLDGSGRAMTTVTSPAEVKPWLAQIAEADIIGDTVGWFVASGEEPIGPHDWTTTAAAIRNHYDEVDGFVVLHALESLPAGATALHLILQSLGKPVVVVGSPLPAPHERTHSARTNWPTTKEYGAKASFINAIQVAISDAGEVLVVYGSHVFRGPTVVSRVEGDRSRLDGEPLGKIDFGIRFTAEHVHRAPRKLKISRPLDGRVTAVEFMPGMTVDQVVAMVGPAAGVFVSSHEAWGALQSALPELAKRLACPLGVYAPGQTTVRAGLVIPGSSRTSALVTFMWVLGQSTSPAAMKKKLASLKT